MNTTTNALEFKDHILATKRIRFELKYLFPETKFWLKNKPYHRGTTSGNSITITWENGPTPLELINAIRPLTVNSIKFIFTHRRLIPE